MEKGLKKKNFIEKKKFANFRSENAMGPNTRTLLLYRYTRSSRFSRRMTLIRSLRDLLPWCKKIYYYIYEKKYIYIYIYGRYTVLYFRMQDDDDCGARRRWMTASRRRAHEKVSQWTNTDWTECDFSYTVRRVRARAWDYTCT